MFQDPGRRLAVKAGPAAGAVVTKTRRRLRGGGMTFAFIARFRHIRPPKMPLQTARHDRLWAAAFRAGQPSVRARILLFLSSSMHRQRIERARLVVDGQLVDQGF